MKYTTNCVVCGKEMQAARSTKRYCSNRCKQANKNKHFGRIHPEIELSVIADAMANLEKCDRTEIVKHWGLISEITAKLSNVMEELEEIENIVDTGTGWQCEGCGNFVTAKHRPLSCKLCKSRGFNPIKPMI